MKPVIKILVFTLIFQQACSQGNIPSSEVQIKLAVLAAPKDKRDGAMVYGYDSKGQLVVLRQGSNEFICLGDNPKEKGLSVACYHKDLEPFMKRGRDLRAEGKDDKTVNDIREAETKSGKLKMNTQPSTLYVYSAKDEDCDLSNGTVKNGYLRYVIYIPYATSESTGLSTKPEGPGSPWIMFPGTARAHIMINPPITN